MFLITFVFLCRVWKSRNSRVRVYVSSVFALWRRNFRLESPTSCHNLNCRHLRTNQLFFRRELRSVKNSMRFRFVSLIFLPTLFKFILLQLQPQVNC